MPLFKTREEATMHGEKNYFHPVVEEVTSKTGNVRFLVYDRYELYLV